MKKSYSSIRQSLMHILKEYELEEKYYTNQLITDWKNIIQPPLSNVAIPVKIESGILTLKANSEAWKKELNEITENIIELVNKAQNHIRIEQIKII